MNTDPNTPAWLNDDPPPTPPVGPPPISPLAGTNIEINNGTSLMEGQEEAPDGPSEASPEERQEVAKMVLIMRVLNMAISILLVTVSVSVYGLCYWRSRRN